jgi:hypothetical protein
MKPQAQLQFELGGSEAERMELRLSRGRLLYTKATGPFPARPPQTIQPTGQQWRQFWLEVDRIGVWAWLPEYTSPDVVLDGTQWRLELCHGARKVKSEGSNAFPASTGMDRTIDPAFAQFLRALAHLTGQQDIAAPPEEVPAAS